jgi:hypothetical protein
VFLETRISLPAIPGPDGLGQILHQRSITALPDRDVAVPEFITPGGVDKLFEHYDGSDRSLRRLMQIAHAALTYACDAGDELIDVAHLELAIAD